MIFCVLTVKVFVLIYIMTLHNLMCPLHRVVGKGVHQNYDIR